MGALDSSISLWFLTFFCSVNLFSFEDSAILAKRNLATKKEKRRISSLFLKNKSIEDVREQQHEQ